MSVEALAKEVADLKRRLDLAETRLSQHAGQFEFISGQLRDIQIYMHTRFEELDKKLAAHDRRFDDVDRRLDRVDQKLDALPRVLAEMIARR